MTQSCAEFGLAEWLGFPTHSQGLMTDGLLSVTSLMWSQQASKVRLGGEEIGRELGFEFISVQTIGKLSEWEPARIVDLKKKYSFRKQVRLGGQERRMER